MLDVNTRKGDHGQFHRCEKQDSFGEALSEISISIPWKLHNGAFCHPSCRYATHDSNAVPPLFRLHIRTRKLLHTRLHNHFNNPTPRYLNTPHISLSQTLFSTTVHPATTGAPFGGLSKSKDCLQVRPKSRKS